MLLDVLHFLGRKFLSRGKGSFFAFVLGWRNHGLSRVCSRSRVVQPVASVDLLQSPNVLSEHQNFAAVFGVVQVSGRSPDLPSENRHFVQQNLYQPRTSERVDSGFVIVPNSDHGEGIGSVQLHVNPVVLAQGERGHPGVQVVLCEVASIDQFVRGSWVVSLSWQDVDVGRTGAHLLLGRVEADRVAILVKQLDACETNVVLITPCVQNADGESLASGKGRHEEGLIEKVEPLLETKLLWLHLRLGRLTGHHVLDYLLWELFLKYWCLLLLFLFCKLIKNIVLEGKRTLDLGVFLFLPLGTLRTNSSSAFLRPFLFVRFVPAFPLWSGVLGFILVESA